MRFMKIYNYISMLFLAGAAIVASCSQNEELTGETPDSLQGFQISVSDEGFMDESGKTDVYKRQGLAILAGSFCEGSEGT